MEAGGKVTMNNADHVPKKDKHIPFTASFPIYKSSQQRFTCIGFKNEVNIFLVLVPWRADGFY